MRKFETFLENIGLKSVSTGEKKPIGKVIGAILVVVIMFIALMLGNKLVNSTNNNKKQEAELKLNGTTTIVVYINQEYKEPGYTATNENGKDVTSKVEVIGNVDTKVAGIYDIIYRLKTNETTITKRRTVTVVDETKSLFMLLGESEKNIKKGEKYVEEGYYLIIPGESEPEKYVTVSGTVDENTPGIYRITYKLDAPSYKYELVRTINVIGENSILPTITLIGNHSQTIKINEAYEEKGFTAYDSVDGDITNKVIVENKVKEGTPGLYEIKYTVKNSRGFQTSISRIIKVLNKDEEAETITTYGGIDDYIKIIPSTKALTKDNITLDITTISSEVKTIILPDKTMTSSKTLKYTIKENGTYIIIVELNDGTKISGMIFIDNIDREGPTGTCQAVYQNGKVSFVVNASDTKMQVEVKYDENNDYTKCTSEIGEIPDYCTGETITTSSTESSTSGISGYSYFNGEKYSDFTIKNAYEIATNKQTGYKVIIKDKIGNTTQIDCASKTLSTVTGIRIIGETKAVLGDKIYLEAVFTPEIVENRKVTWEIIEGNKFGTIDESGVVTIIDDGRFLAQKNNYITVKATSDDSGISATHKIEIYLDKESLEGETPSSGTSGGTSNSSGSAASGLPNPSGIALHVGEEVSVDVSALKKEHPNLKILSLNNTIVSVSGEKIKGVKVGNTKIRIIDGDELLKTYSVGVVTTQCGSQAALMTMQYQIGQKDNTGKLVYGDLKSIGRYGTVTIGVNQILRVKLNLTQDCGQTELLTRTTADGQAGWRNYFKGYSVPSVDRYKIETAVKRNNYYWMIEPKAVTSGFIQLSQTSEQRTEVYSSIKSFANINVKVQKENVDIGRKTSISYVPIKQPLTQIIISG